MRNKREKAQSQRVPAPPYAELSFYFGTIPDANAFEKLVLTSLSLGGSLDGRAYAIRGEDFRNKRFSGIADSLMEEIQVDNDSIRDYLLNPNIRLLQVYMRSVVDVAEAAPEILTYVTISEEAASRDQHPLSIWCEGEVFSGTDWRGLSGKARSVGRKVYTRFIELVRQLNPLYSSITVSYALECPTDLLRDSRSLAFVDFYVKSDYVGSGKMKHILQMYADAYVENVGAGFFVSCTEYFNPRRTKIDNEDAQYRSVDVAKIIAGLA